MVLFVSIHWFQIGAKLCRLTGIVSLEKAAWKEFMNYLDHRMTWWHWKIDYLFCLCDHKFCILVLILKYDLNAKKFKSVSLKLLYCCCLIYNQFFIYFIRPRLHGISDPRLRKPNFSSVLLARPPLSLMMEQLIRKTLKRKQNFHLILKAHLWKAKQARFQLRNYQGSWRNKLRRIWGHGNRRRKEAMIHQIWIWDLGRRARKLRRGIWKRSSWRSRKHKK